MAAEVGRDHELRLRLAAAVDSESTGRRRWRRWPPQRRRRHKLLLLLRRRRQAAGVRPAVTRRRDPDDPDGRRPRGRAVPTVTRINNLDYRL
jgi:hypothetical protein